MDRPRSPRPFTGLIAVLIACAGAAGGLVSCAGTDAGHGARSVRSAAAIEAPLRRLEALAELEAFDPAGDPRALPAALAAAVGMIDPSYPAVIEPGTEVYRRASRTLASVLDEFPLPEPAGELPRASDEDRRVAARTYASARSARAAGEPARAVELLEEAVGLDPASAALWAELGRASSDTGDRVGALDAFRTAAELGDRDAGAMLALASDAASRSDADGVILWAGGALSGDEARRTPEGAIAAAMLGTALLERGNLRAGAEVLGESLNAFDAARNAGEPLELTRLRARRAELAIRAGDAWAALGHPAAALEAYLNAGYSADDAPPVIVQRSLAALVSAGRPAGAAVLFLERVDATAGDQGVEESQWVRGLGGIDRVGGAMTDAMGAMIAEAANPVSVRRQLLRTAVRGVPDAGVALRMLMDAGPVGWSSVVAGDLLWRTQAEQRTDLCLRAVGHDPMLARAFGSALSRLEANPGKLARTLIASGDPDSVLLGLGVCLEIGDARAAGGVPAQNGAAELDAGLLAEAAGRLGRWEDAARWLDAAREQAAAHPERRAYWMTALLSCGRLGEASALGAAIDADAGATAEELLVAGEAALVVGEPDRMRARIARAESIDPFDGRVLERLLAFANEDAASDDGATLRAFGRKLAERRSRGALFTLLRARDLGGRGRLREAAELIATVGDREPSRDLGVLLLAQAGRAGAEQGDGATQELAAGWLRNRARLVPGSVPTAVAVGQALAVEDPGAALAWLDDAYGRIGHPDLARAAEAMLAEEAALADEAGLTGPAQRVVERTRGRGGTEAMIERLAALLRLGDAEGALRAASDALPVGGAMTRAQMERWDLGVQGLSRTPDAVDIAGPLVEVIDRAEAQGEVHGVALSAGLEQARLLLLVRSDGMERLESMVSGEALGEGTGLLAVQALLAGDRVSAGLELLAKLALAADGEVVAGGDGEGEPSRRATLLDEWARLIGAAGDADDVRAMLALLDEDGVALVAGVMRSRFDLEPLPGEPGTDRERADIAYTGGLIASVFERDAEAEGMYRLALSLDPDHAWAGNDLGYALAERGAMLGEAERLTRHAYELLGEKASVMDSLAWALYKQGVFEDVVGDGAVRAGAIGLLRRASALEEGKTNATIFSHLGDALWRAGDRDGALAAWGESEALLRARQIEIAGSQNPGGRGARQTTDRLNEVRRRIADAENGVEPGTARVPVLDGAGSGGASGKAKISE